MRKIDWRDILARLPLPMLALSASYGIYQFALLYVPQWVAIAQAAAFECTYVGLSAQSNLSDTQRQRARVISIGAVCVSVIYNALSGYFHRNPDTLTHAPFTLEIVLAALHGAPLAIVAYAVSDLLLHTERKPVVNLDVKPVVKLVKQDDKLIDKPKIEEIEQSKQSKLDGIDIEALIKEHGSVSKVAEHLGVTRQAVYNRRKVA